MTTQPPQREHCDHEKVCEDLIAYLNGVLPDDKIPVMKCRDVMQDFKCPHDTRSRPHAPAPEQHLTYTVAECIEQCQKARADENRAATLAENKRVLDSTLSIINKNCFELEGKRLKITPLLLMQEIESLRITGDGGK